MALYEKTLFDWQDKVAVALARIRQFCPPEGYWLAFSGGKDSVVIKHLAEMSGVKFEAHYNLVPVDPPELVEFIRASYPDVVFERMAQHTWSICAASCDRKTPTKCCSPAYCRLAKENATLGGKSIAKASDPIEPSVPFLSRTKGCIAPAYLRPTCARYLCFRTMQFFAVRGEKDTRPQLPRDWTDEYDRIAREIDLIERCLAKRTMRQARSET